LESGKLKIISDDIKKVITKYLFDESKKIEISNWKNAGKDFFSPYFTPLRFYLSDELGNILQTSVSNSDEMYIVIQGEIQIFDPSLTLGYAIYSEDGSMLFWSYQTDINEEAWPKLQQGFNCIRSQIPKRFLNQGIYRIEFISSLHFRQWLCQPGKNTPTIFLTIHGGLSDSPYWMVKRPGLLAPVLKWELIT
jgi:lipopolysaccharide transport system ATP-binding protein